MTSVADWQIRCCTCGQFMVPRTLGASWVFVPSSDVSYEEDRWQCAKCTKLHGPIEPNQAVRVEMCSGVVTEEDKLADEIIKESWGFPETQPGEPT